MSASEEKLVTVTFSDYLKWYMDSTKKVSLTNRIENNELNIIQENIINVTLNIESITIK